jgi:hypothetical protein
MALLKPNDKIVLLAGGVAVPGREWKFSQMNTAVDEIRREFLSPAGEITVPLAIVPLKTPTDVLWKIEKTP